MMHRVFLKVRKSSVMLIDGAMNRESHRHSRHKSSIAEAPPRVGVEMFRQAYVLLG